MTPEEAKEILKEKRHYLYLLAEGYVYSVTADAIGVQMDWEKVTHVVEFRIQDGDWEGDVEDLPGNLFRTWPEAYEAAINEAESELCSAQQRLDHLEEERDGLIRGAAAV